jgi:O-antigen/teichoic acid export membrane protein
LGIIAKQAFSNSVNIVLGTVAGAVNTIIILPRAFDDYAEGWGLIKVLISWALIMSQIFSFGSTNIIIRFFPKFKEDPRSLLGLALLLPLIGMALLGLLFLVTGDWSVRIINENDADLLEGRIGLLFLLSLALTLLITLSGYVTSILKTTAYQFLNETYLKSYYLLIAVLYLFSVVSFESLLSLYIAGYYGALLALWIYSRSQGWRISLNFRSLDVRSIATYGGYSVLEKGSAVIVNSLDIIMIGWLIGLNEVAFYTLAFYIGAVTLIPQKAISIVSVPIASAALENQNTAELKSVYLKTSLVQLILGGLIFISVWVSIDEIMALMPAKFQQGKWVVLCIGLSKLFFLASGISGAIIVYSKFYKVIFRLNILLIFITITTNYFFMSESWLNMGINGAALATALSFLIYNSFKVFYVQGKFQMLPFNKSVAFVILLLGVIGTGLYFWKPLPDQPFLGILMKSTLASILFGGSVLLARISPDINEFIAGFVKRNRP